ncbi:nucleoside phosphatase family-domain-containing protein [Naematelia encephala]|uniref:guanosine-diphosphatase n=1 Tax=Naematelia encephala TaxID=71784 RepID=A0A1Y2B610_9TREE|nr:nucleoside phosphatase family-domain-containing protein [Naematelia encephala]
MPARGTRNKSRSKPAAHTRSASTTPSATTSSSVSTLPTRSPSPTPPVSLPTLGLRQRRSVRPSPIQDITNTMFSTRKYSPLPTSGDPRQRKRAGVAPWKRYALIGTAVLVVLLFGYSRIGGHKNYGEEVWDAENTYTPSLDDEYSNVDEIDYTSPPFRPVDSELGSPDTNDEESDPTFHALPFEDIDDHGSVDDNTGFEDNEDLTSAHDPASDEAQGAADADDDFTEITDEAYQTEEEEAQVMTFESDPDPASTIHCTEAHGDKPLVQYALTIDAGSTGSRIHVYKFHNCGPSPQLEYETFKSVQPGLSAHARDPTAAAASLDPLLQEAVRVVPESLRGCTPVEVKATAGLRLLGQQESQAILDEVRNRLETNWEFVVGGERAVEIMDGKDEGVYAWITANYLLNKIGEGAEDTDTLAVMDLGGASTQIVFEPTFPADSEQELVEGEHKYALTFGGKDFTLYQHSYLGYGLMRARRSVHNLVAFTWSFGQGDVAWDELNDEIEVPNPCLTRGSTRSVELDPPGRKAVNVTMHGAVGGFDACNRVVELVMAKDAICEVKPCSFNGVYQPSLLDTFPRGQLLALSYFTDRIKPLLPEDFDSSLTIAALRGIAHDVCAGPEAWGIRWGRNSAAMAELEGRPEYCLDLTFMHALLGLGYELGPGRQLVVEKKLKGVELGWALGAGLALVENAELTCTA